MSVFHEFLIITHCHNGLLIPPLAGSGIYGAKIVVKIPFQPHAVGVGDPLVIKLAAPALSALQGNSVFHVRELRLLEEFTDFQYLLPGGLIGVNKGFPGLCLEIGRVLLKQVLTVHHDRHCVVVRIGSDFGIVIETPGYIQKAV